MQWQDYIDELKRVKLLEPEEEQELWRRFKAEGDEEARARLIESYQPLVFKQAMPFSRREDIFDIVQEGTIGLIEAVERYDYERGVAFSLYAVHRIRGRIYNFLQREGAADIACLDVEGEGELTPKEQLADPRPSVAFQAEQHELTGRLYQALDRLPEKERTVLEGMFLNSQPAQDLAEGLQVSPSHIYRLQKKGIRRVRGMLSRFMQNW